MTLLKLRPHVLLSIGVLTCVPLHAAALGPSDPVQSAALVDTPTVTALKGLTVPQFEAEMQSMTQALGVSCGFCHVRGNFAAETNPRKATARRMIEMTQSINRQFFPDVKPIDSESTLGRVTCATCHNGADRPK